MEPLYIVGRTVKWCNHNENNMVVPQKIKNRTYILSSKPTYICIYPKKLYSGYQKDICTPMFIAALFTIARRWKQPKYSWKNERINKTWYIDRVEYYSALKRKKILSHATVWMIHEDIMLNEICQLHKYKYCTIPLT